LPTAVVMSFKFIFWITESGQSCRTVSVHEFVYDICEVVAVYVITKSATSAGSVALYE